MLPERHAALGQGAVHGAGKGGQGLHLAVDVDLEQRGQEVARIDHQAGLVGIERDGLGGFAGAVDDGGGEALATNCPGGPLAVYY